MIARAKFQGQYTSPGIERAGFVIPANSLFLFPESYVLALVSHKILYFIHVSTFVFLGLFPIEFSREIIYRVVSYIQFM